ncbi:MAG: histidinol-phosphatase HisJ family protein [Promethearchaeia archaeon]
MKFKYTDFHVHTRWSHDIANFGPTFDDYAIIAEKYKINICFLDHYKLYYIENDPNYPFYGNKIEQYLEEIDKIKEIYDFVLSGLEVDYYEKKENELREFMDNYGNQFDFIAGTIHETEYGYPVTIRAKLLELLKKKDLKIIVDDYYNLMEKMIKSKIFKNICHLDTIFRYINLNDIVPGPEIDISNDRIIELGLLCIENNIKIEYNLSGYKYPLNRTFPSKNVVKFLAKKGAKFFVGSDSHDLLYFKNSIKKVKEAYEFINNIQ